jgi:hypothetical protein
MGQDKIVISESNGEAYIGSLHANLALYGWFNCGFVPAFQSTCLIRALARTPVWNYVE